jgi:thiosulfate/3-mercaptopyruvate sulfurtransferase
VKLRGTYARPEALADAKWVAGHLDDPTVRIIDARRPLEAALYATGHIPGAVYVNVFSDLCCPSKIMPADQFEALMGKLGIGDDTAVVVYDTHGGLWAARLWWALKYYGHDQVMLLNGGLMAWVLAGQTLETETPAVTPAVFHADPQPGWLAARDEVKSAITDPQVALLDALTRPNYVGDLEAYAKPGHIASALSFPAPDTLDPVMQTVLAPADLSRMLIRLQLDLGQRVITYCGGGIYGAHAAFVLHLMGFENVGLYDGSLMDWMRSTSTSSLMEVEP